jgi:ribosomal protein S10
MFINIQIFSKNETSITSFLEFLSKISNKKSFKIILLLKCFPQKNKKNIFTILKSPHVNKTAQEQFEYNVFSVKIQIQTFQMLKFLVILKRMQIELFADIQIKIYYNFKSQNFKSIRTTILDPQNYRTQYFFKKKLLHTKLYIQLFDVFGIQLLN